MRISKPEICFRGDSRKEPTRLVYDKRQKMKTKTRRR